MLKRKLTYSRFDIQRLVGQDLGTEVAAVVAEPEPERAVPGRVDMPWPEFEADGLRSQRSPATAAAPTRRGWP